MSLYLKESNALRAPPDSPQSMDLKPPSMALPSPLLMAGAPNVGVGPFSPTAGGLGALSWAAAALSSAGLLGPHPPPPFPNGPLPLSLPPSMSMCALSQQHSPSQHQHQQLGPQFGPQFGPSSSGLPHPNDAMPIGPPFEQWLETLAQLRHCGPAALESAESALATAARSAFGQLPASPLTPSVLANSRTAGGDAQFFWPPHAVDTSGHQLDRPVTERKEEEHKPSVSGTKRKSSQAVERTSDSQPAAAKRVSKFDIASLLPAVAETSPADVRENVVQQQGAQQQPPAPPNSAPLPCALQHMFARFLQQQSQAAQMRASVATSEHLSSLQAQALQLSPASTSSSSADSSSSSSSSSTRSDPSSRRLLHEFAPVVDLLATLSAVQSRLVPANGEL